MTFLLNPAHEETRDPPTILLLSLSGQQIMQ